MNEDANILLYNYGNGRRNSNTTPFQIQSANLGNDDVVSNHSSDDAAVFWGSEDAAAVNDDQFYEFLDTLMDADHHLATDNNTNNSNNAMVGTASGASVVTDISSPWDGKANMRKTTMAPKKGRWSPPGFVPPAMTNNYYTPAVAAAKQTPTMEKEEFCAEILPSGYFSVSDSSGRDGPWVPASTTAAATAQAGVTQKTQESATTIFRPPYPRVPKFDQPNTTMNRMNTTKKAPKNTPMKRSRETSSTVEDKDEEKERRRKSRNVREQKRAHRSVEEISNLQDILAAANIEFQPNKYSTLSKTVEYVIHLQDRAAKLELEHQAILKAMDAMAAQKSTSTTTATTATATASCSDSCNDPQSQASVISALGSSIRNGSITDASSSSSTTSTDEGDSSKIDYKRLFFNSGIASASTSLTGRFLDINKEFERISGYDRSGLLSAENSNQSHRNEMAPLQKNKRITWEHNSTTNKSFFDILSQEDIKIVFDAIGNMLRYHGTVLTSSQLNEQTNRGFEYADFWTGQVCFRKKIKEKFQLNVTLVRTSSGKPEFFICTATPSAQVANRSTAIPCCSYAELAA